MHIPMLSIVVPMFNSSQTIERCVESLVMQSMTDLEILLIDDGSTDDTLEKCRRLAAKDGRIKVLSKKNAGQGIARNFGMDLATGEYIAFVDSDDTCMETMYETLLREAKNRDSDIVLGGYCDIRNGVVIKNHPLESQELCNKEQIDAYMADLIFVPGNEIGIGCIAVWDAVFRQSPLKENGIKFPSERDVYSEDLVFKLKALGTSTRVSFVPECLYEYHVSEKSYSKRVSVGAFERISGLSEVLTKDFEERIGRFDLCERIAGRVFVSLKYFLRQAPKGIDRPVLFNALVKNEDLYRCLSAYQPATLVNKVIYGLLQTKNPRFISAFFNLISLKG